ncbi:glycoside hydrolase family 18 protein [Peribacillus loiseleuriae]|uniref:chitinase n=1 Tax=Peribacillus loiseleuriae TaxID=1679170 RepID=A0A0K9GUG4_9BACI|nr:glycoside hydrolase family 18 protein [Peribacillus loiseleuriae]KMY50281.1 chitinase [Peribacillus loiseleuriae]
MKNLKLLLLLVLVITFTGGFFAGKLFSTNNQQERLTMEQTTKSAIKPVPKQLPKLESEQAKVLIGYIQDFRDPDKLDYDNMTHIIFSFAHPTKDGGLLLNGETALNNLRVMVSKAHMHDTKVILAVGGWYHIQGGESYEYFKSAIANPVSRYKLINELVSIVDRENLDGIDIDFEHPRSWEDAQDLASFIKVLSEKLHDKDKELSTAVQAKINSVTGSEINNVLYEPSMFEYVDHVNIMAYDGQWDGGYVAANLSPYPFNEKVVNYWTKLFEAHNLSKEKLVLGVPFYAQPEDPSIKQISYEAIIKNNPKNAERDTVNMNGTTYYYNGAKTIQKKTKLALDNGFGGMMLWEAGHDAKGLFSLTGVISKALKADDIYVFKQNNILKGID